jgi:hypothetical protein
MLPGRTLRSRLVDLPRWLKFAWPIWAAPLVIWVPVVVGAASHHAHEGTLIVLGSVFGGAALLATLVMGVLLGHRRAWGYLGWTILIGTVVLGAVMFFVAAALEPSNGKGDDPGMGIGALFVTACCVPPMLLVLSLGGSMGTLVRRLR